MGTGLSDLEQLCHKQSPVQIRALLTAELDRFTELILGLRGTVDSYLGFAEKSAAGQSAPRWLPR